MSVRQTVQAKLDKVLLPYGILSHHIRRVEVGKISNSTVKVNQTSTLFIVSYQARAGRTATGARKLSAITSM